MPPLALSDAHIGEVAVFLHARGRGALVAGTGRWREDRANINLLARDPATGKTLWHSYGGGRMASSPSTYWLDGRQYVLTGVDGVLYAWSLPERR